MAEREAESLLANRRVFCILLSDRDDAVGLARLLSDVRLTNGPSPRLVAPPVVGAAFFHSLDAGDIADWWTQEVNDAQVVYVVQHQDKLPATIAGRIGRFYVGVPQADLQTTYPSNVVTFIAVSPLDYATVIMRDFSGALKDEPTIFDEGEALRMAALATDFPLDLEEPVAVESEEDTRLRHAIELYHRGDYQSALAEFERCLQTGYDQPGLVHLWRAAAAQHLGDLALEREAYLAAITACTRVIESGGPGTAQAFAWRADAFDAIGQTGRASDDYAEAVAHGSESPELLYSQGTLLTERGRYQDALRVYDKVLSLEPSHALALQAKGVVLAYLDQYAPAVEALRASIRANPNNPGPYRALGVCLHELETFDEALKAYDQAASLGYSDPVLDLSRGLTLARMERYEAAIANYERALTAWREASWGEEQEGVVRAYAGLAHTWMMLRRFPEAERACRDARAHGDTSDDTLTMFGYILCQLDRPDEGEAYIQQALKESKDPHAIDEWRTYGVLGTVRIATAELFHDDEYFELAIDAVDEALHKLPKTPLNQDQEDVARLFLHRGYALARLGRYREVTADFRRSARRAPSGSTLRLAANRYLRRLQMPRGLEVPPWMSPVVALAAVLLIAGATVLLVLDKLSSPSFAALVLGLAALPIVTYSLPTMSKFKLGPAEMQRELGTIGNLRLAPLQPQPPRVALQQLKRHPRKRRER